MEIYRLVGLPKNVERRIKEIEAQTGDIFVLKPLYEFYFFEEEEISINLAKYKFFESCINVFNAKIAMSGIKTDALIYCVPSFRAFVMQKNLQKFFFLFEEIASKVISIEKNIFRNHHVVHECLIDSSEKNIFQDELIRLSASAHLDYPDASSLRKDVIDYYNSFDRAVIDVHMQKAKILKIEKEEESLGGLLRDIKKVIQERGSES